MAVLVLKTAASIMLCVEELKNTINADVSIVPICEDIVVSDETDLELYFSVALSPTEDLSLDGILGVFVCPAGTGLTPPNPGQQEDESDATAIGIISIDITPSNTTTIDSIDISTVSAIKWFITITDVVGGQVVGFDVLALHNAGISPTHNIVGEIGSTNILYNVDVTIVGSYLVLSVNNNEPINTLTVDAARISVLG